MGLKDLLVRIRADNSELDKAVIESSRRLEQVGKRLDRMGRSLSLNVTAPILALGGAAVASSIKFEDAMAGVAKTVDASAETITALGDEFKDLSEQIPVAATELANIGEAAGQLGIATNNILGFTRVMADLGVATNLTSEEAATDLARLANITGMPQNAFDRLGSTVVALGNNLATTEREIVAMGLRLAGAGTQVGLTEDQILALAGSLSSVGIEAESGGTALSKVMAEMAIAVGDGGEKLEQFARIAGMSGAEFAEVFESDAADAIATFVEGLGRLKDEGVNVFQVLKSVEFGNIRVRDALLRASGAGELMRKSLDLGSTAWRENTALTIEAEKFNATTGNQLKIVWNQVRNMAAEMGDNLTPALLAMVDAAKPVLEVVGNMIRGFGELPKSIQTTAIGMVALTAVLGPALVAISRITTALGMLRGAAALGGLSAMLLPGAPILAGLALLAGGFLLAKKGADDASRSVADLQRQMEGLTGTTSDLTEAQIIMQTAEALDREAEARRKLADAERELASVATGDVERKLVAFERVSRLREDLAEALADIERLTDAFNKPQSPKVPPGPTVLDDPGAQTSLDKQAALAKRLQDEMVAMTKTAVDDMQLEYDRLEAHIIEVDGAISEGWQKMLDGMQADIAAVGLAEQFPALAIIEDMNAELAKADQLEASLGPGFDLVSAKVNIFRSALEELIDAGLEPVDEEYQHVLDSLLRFTKAQQDAAEAARDLGKSVGFFEGLEGQAKSILDPTQIASSALGNLLSGGISTVMSGLTSALGGLFGPSDAQLAAAEALRVNTEAVRKNMEAADRLGDNLNALSNATVTLPFDAASQALAAGQAERSRRAFEGFDPDQPRDPKRAAAIPFDESILAQFGLTMPDIEAIAKALRVDFQDLSRDADALLVALENLNSFNRDFGLLQKQFALFDIEDPGEKFASVMDLLAGQVSDGFAAVLEGLTPENFDSFLEDMFADGFASFDKSLLGDDLEFDQFLTAIGFAEGALDGLATEGEKATEALRNAPAGFKVALARFTASDPELPQARLPDPPILPPILPPDVSLPPLPPALPPLPPPVYDWDNEEEDSSSDIPWARARNTQNTFNVTMHGVNDPREFLSKLEDEVEWRARTGASVIPSKNEMRR